MLVSFSPHPNTFLLLVALWYSDDGEDLGMVDGSVPPRQPSGPVDQSQTAVNQCLTPGAYNPALEEPGAIEMHTVAALPTHERTNDSFGHPVLFSWWLLAFATGLAVWGAVLHLLGVI